MNGFSHDVIANGVGSAITVTTSDVDGANYCFKSADWQLNESSALSAGLPNNGTIVSSANNAIIFQLQSYSSNNSIRLDTNNTTITSIVSNGAPASDIYILATGGSGSATLGGTITFTDNTTQSYSGLAVSDWYGANNFAIQGIGRINRITNAVEPSTTNPRLYQIALPIDLSNQTKTIQSITFNKTAGGGIINVFGVTMKTLGTCPSPSTVNISNITTNTATIAISVPAIVPSNGYDYEVRTSGNPGSGATGLVTNGVSITNDYTINNLPSSLTLQLYVRSNCGTTQGEWSGPFAFTMLCDTIGTFFENFDLQATGSTANPNLPNCWSVVKDGSGYAYISSTNYSSPRSVYLYNSSQNSGNLIVVSPNTDNLGNGNYRVRFRARGNGYALKIVTLASNTSAQNLVEVATINLTGNFDEYIVNLPAGTNDFFGFAHGFGGMYRAIYIDDVYFEPIPACQTPLNPTITNVTLTGATFNWVASTSANSNGYTYELRTSGNPGSGNTGLVDTNTTDAATLTKIFTNLQGGTTYTAYVKANCTSTSESTWTNGVTFTPDWCNPTYSSGNFSWRTTMFSIPEVSFTDNIPTNATNNRLNVAIPTLHAGETYTFNATTIGWVSVGFAADFNNDGDFSDANETLALPEYEDQYPNYSSSVTIPDNITPGTYRLRVWNRQANSSTDLGTNPCGSYNYGIWFNYNITIGAPLCHAPSSITTSTISTNSALINWTSLQTNFEVAYGPTGFDVTTANTTEVTNSSFSIQNLSPSTTYDFYVRAICNENLNSEWTLISFTTLCDTPAPTGNSTQILINDDTFDDIVINGSNVKIYDNTEHVSAIPNSQTIIEGTYYATQTIGCESAEHLVINVQVVQRVAQPTVSNPFIVCASTTLGEVALGLVNGTTVKWYASANSTEVLSSNTLVDTNTTYYVTQSDQYSESHRTMVQFVVNPVPSTLTTTQYTVCGAVTFNQIALPENYVGTLVWYPTIGATTPINGQTVASTGMYYVAQYLNGCYSERTLVSINAISQIPTPNANVIDICGSGTVADLDAVGISGAQFNWYSSSTSLNTLSETTPLTTGTYYVEQVFNGCTSTRKAVSVRVNSIVAPSIQNMTVCENTTFAQLPLQTTQNISYKWFNSPTSTTEIPNIFNITSGTYYVARITNGCESNRTMVTLTVTTNPTAPTGTTVQTFENNLATIADLTMDQTGIVWYISYNDAVNGTNPLQSNMPLVDGQTYYAVLINGSCRSLPTAVSVHILLSNHGLDLNHLKVYPNPTEGELFVEYSESIDFIEIFSITGEKISTKNISNNLSILDITELSSGMYLLKIQVGSSSQTIKIFKK